ncbi:unnamed protein product, partial [Timema podura]|nr:unnamed protein product [Timema podura]
MPFRTKMALGIGVPISLKSLILKPLEEESEQGLAGWSGLLYELIQGGGGIEAGKGHRIGYRCSVMRALLLPIVPWLAFGRRRVVSADTITFSESPSPQHPLCNHSPFYSASNFMLGLKPNFLAELRVWKQVRGAARLFVDIKYSIQSNSSLLVAQPFGQAFTVTGSFFRLKEWTNALAVQGISTPVSLRTVETVRQAFGPRLLYFSTVRLQLRLLRKWNCSAKPCTVFPLLLHNTVTVDFNQEMTRVEHTHNCRRTKLCHVVGVDSFQLHALFKL